MPQFKTDVYVFDNLVKTVYAESDSLINFEADVTQVTEQSIILDTEELD